MKFKLGDFVRFVDEKREGYVTRIIDASTLGVTDSDGFEIPVAINNLTTVYSPQEEEKEAQPLKPVSKNESPGLSGTYLAVIDDKKAPDVIHFHLLNQSSDQLLVSTLSEKKQSFTGVFSGILDAYTSGEIHTASLADLDLWPRFHFRVLIHRKSSLEIAQPVNIVKKFRAKDFSGDKKEISPLKAKGWLIPLEEAQPLIDPQALKESFFRGTQEKLQVEAPPKEIDLHIEKLRDDYHFLNADEILKIQTDHFLKMLEAAIVHKMTSIIFIHGLGNGTLRHQIHKTAGKHPQVKTFMDAQKDKFGYGATEIFLK